MSLSSRVYVLARSCYSVTQSCSTLCNPMDCSTPGLPVPHHLPKFMSKFTSIASMMPSSHFILWRPLLLLPSIFPSIRDFSGGSSVHFRWPKDWSFSFIISPSMNISGLFPLRLIDLLAVQVPLRSLLSTHTQLSFLVLKGFGKPLLNFFSSSFIDIIGIQHCISLRCTA